MADPVSYALLFAAALIVGIVLILLFTRSSVRREAPQGMGAALLALADNDRASARKILTEAVRAEESSAEAFLVLGRLLREDGEAERALGLHRALLARPRLAAGNRLATELELLRDLLALGRNEEALERAQALARHFHDLQVVELQARALIAAGRMEAAAEVWHAGLRGEKNAERRLGGALFLAEIGREYLRLGQPDTAERWARQARKIDTRCALAEVVLGDVERGRSNDSNAREHYESALRLGGARWVLPRLIEHSLRQGQIDRLIDVLEPVRIENPDDSVLSRAVLDLHLRRGDRDEFFALLESDERPVLEDPAIWAGWTRHLVSAGEEKDLVRLLACLPAAFGPSDWVCRDCGAEDHEPRAACMSCGSPQALVVHPGGEST